MNARFMIVDDTKFMRTMLTDILVKQDYEVVGEADNGVRAIELYKELMPDVVFMDISMPEMDGIEALKRIRAINPKAIVIICSGISQQYLISDAMKVGADGYVMKPFKPKQIKEVIQKYAVDKISESRSYTTMNAIQELLQIESAASVEESAEEFPPAVMLETAEQMIEELPPVMMEEEEVEEELIVEETILMQEEEVEEIEEELEEEEVEEIEEELEEAVIEWEEVEEIEVVQEGGEEPFIVLGVEEEEQVDEVLEEEPIVEQLKASLDTQPPSVNDPEEKEVLSAVDTTPAEETARAVAAVYPIHPYQNHERFKGESTVKEFTSSISCRWKEDIGEREVTYSAVCYEGENRVHIDIAGQDGGTVVLSFDGLKNLVNWIEAKATPIPNPVIELARRS